MIAKHHFDGGVLHGIEQQARRQFRRSEQGRRSQYIAHTRRARPNTLEQAHKRWSRNEARAGERFAQQQLGRQHRGMLRSFKYVVAYALERHAQGFAITVRDIGARRLRGSVSSTWLTQQKRHTIVDQWREKFVCESVQEIDRVRGRRALQHDLQEVRCVRPSAQTSQSMSDGLVHDASVSVRLPTATGAIVVSVVLSCQRLRARPKMKVDST